MIAALSLAFSAALFAAEESAPPTHSGPGRVVLVAGTRDAAARPPSPTANVLVLVLAPSDARSDSEFVAARAAGSNDADVALAAALEHVDAIELRGGTWLGWYQAAHDKAKERAWTRALRSAHARGASVRASGAAATWISKWTSVPRKVLGRPAQVPHDTSLDVPVEGLGLFDAAFLGVFDAAGGVDTPGADRVVECAFAYSIQDVLLVSGRAEVEWDPVQRTLRALSVSADAERPAESIVWLDLSAGKRSREVVRGVRASFLRTGDIFELRTRTLVGGIGGVLEPAARTRIDAWARELLEPAKPEAPGASALPSWIRRATWSSDERTRHTEHGGLGDVVWDLEFARP